MTYRATPSAWIQPLDCGGFLAAFVGVNTPTQDAPATKRCPSSDNASGGSRRRPPLLVFRSSGWTKRRNEGGASALHRRSPRRTEATALPSQRRIARPCRGPLPYDGSGHAVGSEKRPRERRLSCTTALLRGAGAYQASIRTQVKPTGSSGSFSPSRTATTCPIGEPSASWAW